MTKCAVCGKDFKETPIEEDEKKFCSAKCHDKYLKCKDKPVCEFC